MAARGGRRRWASTPTTCSTASTGGDRHPRCRSSGSPPRRRRWWRRSATTSHAAADAIRTTDLRTKLAFRELELGGQPVQFAAIAKGSGMIHPQMATMLCFIATDAADLAGDAAGGAARAVDETFNTITVDGDMSTNDTVIALANGALGRAGHRGATAPSSERSQAR